MPNPVTLNDATKAVVDYRLNNLHTALPAEIISYDYRTQKASVQPLLNKVWNSALTPNDPNSPNALTTPMPVLENVPVIFPRAGGAGLTFPVVQGDTCLLVFVERSMDLWLTVGGQVSPDDNRKFDLSDAVAIPGLFPFTETSTATNNTDMLLSFSGSEIRILPTGEVDIKTASKVAIGTSTVELLQKVIDLCTSLATNLAVGPGPYPGVVTDAGNIAIALTTIKGTIT